MTTRIIAIAGAKGSGKSALKDAIMTLFPNTAMPVLMPLSFATPMKLMLLSLGVPTEALYGDDAAKNTTCTVLMGKTVRYAMVTLATEWGRNHINYDMWVMALALKISYIEQSAPDRDFVIVIDDLRFQNELDWVLSMGGTVLGIERGQLPKRPSRLAKFFGAKDVHVSEQMPYRFDELQIPVIKNDGSLADLNQAVLNCKALSV